MSALNLTLLVIQPFEKLQIVISNIFLVCMVSAYGSSSYSNTRQRQYAPNTYQVQQHKPYSAPAPQYAPAPQPYGEFLIATS